MSKAMPELPEVETIRRGLAQKVKGLKIKKVEVLLPKQFKGDPKEVDGARVRDVRRRGKINIIDLDNGKSLLIHLKLTGQLVYHRDGEKFVGGHPIPFAGGSVLPAKSTRIIFNFADGSRLFYNDVRQFGWIKVVNSDQLSIVSEVAKLGPEPFDKEFTLEYLQKIFSQTSKPIKLVLMDQEKIAGAGNIYANDALNLAKILPTRPAKSLSEADIKMLKESITRVLEAGLKYGGSTGADEAFVNVEGKAGSYQEHFKVYQRAGQKCPNCGGTIKRIELGGRGTFFCPKCQK